MPRKKRKSFDFESFDAPGLKMERQGRLLAVKSERTDEQQRALLADLKRSFDSAQAKIEEEARNLEALLPKFNTFDLLSYFAIRLFFVNPDLYKESEQKEGSYGLEYLCLLALKREFQQGERPITPDDVQAIDSHLIAIESAMRWRLMTEYIDPEDTSPPNALEQLQIAARLQEFGVRGFAYPIHHQEVLRDLFGPFSDFLRGRLGFEVSDAIHVTGAISDLLTIRIRERLRQASARKSELLSAVKRFRSGEFVSPEQRVVVEPLADLTSRDLGEWVKSMSVAWAVTLAGDAMSISCRDLADAAGISEAVVSSYLERFSMEFGGISSDLYMPPLMHPLKERPLIQEKNRFLCPVSGLLEWAIQPALEASLKSEQRIWKKYERHRHDVTLRKSVELILSAIPDSKAYSNLHYKHSSQQERTPGSDDFELDALILSDTSLFLLEVKAGNLTPPARQGLAKRLDRDFKSLVSKAHEQAIRAASYIESQDLAAFVPDRGRELVLRTADFSRKFMISVTLEPLGYLTSLLQATATYAPNDTQIVWSVSLYDLFVIADLSEKFWGIPHYIERRNRAVAQGVIEAGDELDLFGCYIDSGLYFEPDRLDVLKISTFTDPIDAYYLHQAGIRKKMAPKPRQKSSPEFFLFMDNLAGSQLSSRLDFLLLLADLNGESRRVWMRGVVESKRRYRRDGKSHDFSLSGPSNGGWGLTYICGPEEIDSPERLQNYCEAKARKLGIKTWCGVYDVGTKKYNFKHVVVIRI